MVEIGIGGVPGLVSQGIPVSAIQDLVLSMQISHYGTVLVVTALVYDFLTTIRYEIKYVWKRNSSLIKALFLANRYLCVLYFGWNLFLQFVPSPSDKFCLISTFCNYIIGVNVAMAGTGVLLLRTWALYHRNPKLPIAYIAMYCLVIGPLAVMVFRAYILHPPPFTYSTALARAAVPLQISGANTTAIDAIPIGSISGLDPVFIGCYIAGYPENFTILYLASLISESILFVLTVYKLWKLRLSSGLAVVLFRDGAIYYLMIMGSLVCAIVFGRSEGLERSVGASGFFLACKSMAISHLIIRLRGYLAPEPELTIFEHTMPDERTMIQFAPPILTSSALYGERSRIDLEELTVGHASVGLPSHLSGDGVRSRVGD